MEQSISATVAAKQGVYNLDAPEMDPHGDPLFEVAFETPEGVKIFWINSMEYYRLEVGMHGLLKYDGNNIISFGSWIHPFDMNQPDSSGPAA